MNRRVVEALVRAGAFDALDDHRARLLANVPRAMEAAEQAERHARQVSLFGGGEGGAQGSTAMVPAPRWDERQRLAEEKAALGFYLSGHPFAVYRRELASVVRTALAELQPKSEPVLLAGMVVSCRTAMTRRGKMGIILLDDGTAQIEVSVYSEIYDLNRDLLKEDRPLVIQGKVTRDGLQRQQSRGCRAALRHRFGPRAPTPAVAPVAQRAGVRRGQGAAAKLRELLGPYRNGPCPVSVCYSNGRSLCEVKLGETWNVSPDDGLVEQLTAWLKPENVQFVYA